MSVNAKMTSEYSNFSEKRIYVPHNFTDYEDNIQYQDIINRMRDYRKQLATVTNQQEKMRICREMGDLLKNNGELIKSFTIDSSLINAISEELRNIEIYLLNEENQKALYQSTITSVVKNGDIWIGDLEITS